MCSFFIPFSLSYAIALFLIMFAFLYIYCLIKRVRQWPYNRHIAQSLTTIIKAYDTESVRFKVEQHNWNLLARLSISQNKTPNAMISYPSSLGATTTTWYRIAIFCMTCFSYHIELLGTINFILDLRLFLDYIVLNYN